MSEDDQAEEEGQRDVEEERILEPLTIQKGDTDDEDG